MTRYMLSVHHAIDEKFPPMEELQPVSRRSNSTGDKPIVTDGPYTESKEYLGGFWVIEAPDLDAALGWAKQASTACAGKVEVRSSRVGAGSWPGRSPQEWCGGSHPSSAAPS